MDAQRQFVPFPRRLLLGVLVLARRGANVFLRERERDTYAALAIHDENGKL